MGFFEVYGVFEKFVYYYTVKMSDVKGNFGPFEVRSSRSLTLQQTGILGKQAAGGSESRAVDGVTPPVRLRARSRARWGSGFPLVEFVVVAFVLCLVCILAPLCAPAATRPGTRGWELSQRGRSAAAARWRHGRGCVLVEQRPSTSGS